MQGREVFFKLKPDDLIAATEAKNGRDREMIKKTEHILGDTVFFYFVLLLFLNPTGMIAIILAESGPMFSRFINVSLLKDWMYRVFIPNAPAAR